jgi:branched-chain amino acid transport system substrate-binding protein
MFRARFARLRFARLAAAMALGAVIGAAAAGDAGAQDILKVGVAISQSGTFVREGQFLRDGYQLWADKANAAGGIKVGGKAYKVELVIYDDESQAQTSAKLTERLITEDKVQFLFGPYSSGIANATAAISERYKILTIDPMATANNLFTRGYKYFFCPAALGNTGLWPVLLLAQQVTPKPTTVAIVGPDDLFPNNNAAGAKEKAEQLGFKVVYAAKYPKGAPDLSAVATGIKAASPDIVLASGYSQDSILLIKALRELQVTPNAIGLATAVAVPDFRAALGSAAEGMMGVDYWSPTLSYGDRFFKNSQQFADEFEKRFGHPPYYHAAAGAASGIILQTAIEKAQSLDSTAVRDAMLQISGETFFTRYKFQPDGTNSLATLFVAQILNGEPKIVFPLDIAQSPYHYPATAAK